MGAGLRECIGHNRLVDPYLEVVLDVLVLDSPNGSSIRPSTLFKDCDSMCEWVHTSVPVASARCLPKFLQTCEFGYRGP